VVFMGERRAERRHDAVAHYLIDSALVVMDGVHHQREDWIDELTRVLGFAIGEQLHGALEVGKQHGDVLALAFKRRLGGEDFLGEVLGGVALGGWDARSVGCRRRDLLAALRAELGGGREFTSTLGTCARQSRPAI
jgi:hypothetical protein